MLASVVQGDADDCNNNEDLIHMIYWNYYARTVARKFSIGGLDTLKQWSSTFFVKSPPYRGTLLENRPPSYNFSENSMF